MPSATAWAGRGCGIGNSSLIVACHRKQVLDCTRCHETSAETAIEQARLDGSRSPVLAAEQGGIAVSPSRGRNLRGSVKALVAPVAVRCLKSPKRDGSPLSLVVRESPSRLWLAQNPGVYEPRSRTKVGSRHRKRSRHSRRVGARTPNSSSRSDCSGANVPVIVVWGENLNSKLACCEDLNKDCLTCNAEKSGTIPSSEYAPYNRHPPAACGSGHQHHPGMVRARPAGNDKHLYRDRL